MNGAMMPPELMERVEELRRLVDAHFLVQEVYVNGGLPAFAVHPTPDLRERFLRLRRVADPLDLLPVLRRRDGRPVVAFVPRPPRTAWRWPVNLGLFVATLITTFLAGYTNALSLVQAGYLRSAVGGGLAFSLSLMLILATHEMGHKILSIRRGVDASLPYFIPMIPPLGTMGAVIITRTPAPNRDALMDVAAAGPLAGFLAAIPVLIVGVSRSFVISPAGFEGINLPDPLILQWLIRAILAPADGMVVLGHPILFAGWIGLLVTSLNLLPAGMLDGGHVSRSLLGPRLHTALSAVAIVAAFLLGYRVMALLILILMGRRHPGPLDDVSPVSPGRILLGLILLGIFILSVVRFPTSGLL
jgi:membrane-associated protease RseP (regulator of RpoE activity)